MVTENVNLTRYVSSIAANWGIATCILPHTESQNILKLFLSAQ